MKKKTKPPWTYRVVDRRAKDAKSWASAHTATGLAVFIVSAPSGLDCGCYVSQNKARRFCNWMNTMGNASGFEENDHDS